MIRPHGFPMQFAAINSDNRWLRIRPLDKKWACKIGWSNQ